MSMSAAGQRPPSVNLGLEVRSFFKTPIGEVDPTYALIDPEHCSEPTREFFVPNQHQRFIATASDGQVAEKHSVLLENRLPVFSALFTDKLMLLQVPEGARSVTSMLTSIARHPRSAEPLFAQVGRLFGDIEDVDGMGLPELPVFDQLAFVADSQEPSGIKLYMTPPYSMNESITRPEFLDQISMELDLAVSIGSSAITRLVEVVEQGWDDNDR